MTCKECGQFFVPNKPWQKFCNRDCKDGYWKRHLKEFYEEMKNDNPS